MNRINDDKLPLKRIASKKKIELNGRFKMKKKIQDNSEKKK
jgi:hypothetical protein